MSAWLTLSILGALLGLGLAFAAEALKVPTDPRIGEVEARLPGINCGLCGYPGCNAFATAIVEEEAEKLSLCKPGKESHYQAILDYLKDHPDAKGRFVSVAK
jgi:electron transport complex protein RnfB